MSHGRLSGLSPPTRGSRPCTSGWLWKRGSIPAHAGEPFGPTGYAFELEVYPRPRGGAFDRKKADDETRGLSPPTRGSLCGDATRPPFDRSIPAHAGEPRGADPVVLPPKVYPRPRGGATACVPAC